MHLSWIIPAYNEERRIGKTVREVHQYLQSKQISDGYEIIVVDSSSKDRTYEIAEGLRSSIAELKILRVVNKGKGYAVREGMFFAHGDIRLFSDADNSTPPESFDRMEPLFREGYDVVISSRNPRDVPGATRDVKEPWYREVLGTVGNVIIQSVGVWGIWDTQNGFKAVTAASAKKIFSRMRIQEFAFDVEMLALARKMNCKIGIVPIRWRFDPDSKVTAVAYLRFFADVFRIRWNFLTGIYKM